MIAFSLDNLLFLLLIAVAALFQLLSKAINKAGKSNSNETSSSPTPQTPQQIQRAPRKRAEIRFVNSSKHWVSRQAQLPLRLCSLVVMFRLDGWRLCNRLQYSQAGGDYIGNTER